MYVFTYAFCLHTPSRRRADNAASFAVAFFFVMHFLSILLLASGLLHRQLITAVGKTGIAVATIAIIAGFTFYFRNSDRGALIVENNAKVLAQNNAKWIGLIIVIWAFCAPFLSIAGFLLLIHRS